MIIIGITGSIGMGKTTISSMLNLLNIPIFDSDKEVRSVLEKNEIVIDQIQRIWPDVVSIEMEQKKIDKFSLSNKIFENNKNRKLLEKIIHPIIKESRVQFISKYCKSRIVGLDVPLLYETKTNEICNYIFLVNTSRKIQQKRVLKRPKMTKEKFDLINKVQWSFKKKKKMNPFVIDTSFGKLFSFIQVLIYLVIIIVKQKVKSE
tara:strand:- start:754 stop:1368 length:615 start_codon:yes stop_codon:yes gene_type:complete